MVYTGLSVPRPTRTAIRRPGRRAPGVIVRVADPVGGRTDYQYDAFGLLKQASDPDDNVVSAVSYNLRGMRTGLTDMNLGTWSYSPNALGEVISQTDAKGQTTSFVYDPLGRPRPAQRGRRHLDLDLGHLDRREQSSASSLPWRARATPRPTCTPPRPAASRAAINADATYPYDYSYNTLGRLHTLTYPTSTAGVRFQAKYVYTNGCLSICGTLRARSRAGPVVAEPARCARAVPRARLRQRAVAAERVRSADRGTDAAQVRHRRPDEQRAAPSYPWDPTGTLTTARTCGRSSPRRSATTLRPVDIATGPAGRRRDWP